MDYKNVNSKWIKNLNIWPETIELLERNMRGSSLSVVQLSFFFFFFGVGEVEIDTKNKGKKNKDKQVGLH